MREPQARSAAAASSSSSPAAASSSSFSDNDAFRIVLAGTFTLEPTEAHIRWAASNLPVKLELVFAGFGQAMQSLLDPSEAFYATKANSGANVLFVRPKDVPNPRELSDAVNEYNRAARAPLCVVVCPQLEPTPSDWELELASCTNVLSAALADHWPVEPSDYDARAEQLGGIPYSTHVYCGMGVLALRMASYASRRTLKLVCVDCDVRPPRNAHTEAHSRGPKRLR